MQRNPPRGHEIARPWHVINPSVWNYQDEYNGQMITNAMDTGQYTADINQSNLIRPVGITISKYVHSVV